MRPVFPGLHSLVFIGPLFKEDKDLEVSTCPVPSTVPGTKEASGLTSATCLEPDP